MIIYFPTGFLDIRYHSSDSRYLQKIDQGLNYNRSILGNEIFFLKSSSNTTLIVSRKNPCPRFRSRQVFCEKQLFPEAQRAGLRGEKKSLASIYEILLVVEEDSWNDSFDIDRIKGVERS